MDDTSIDAVTIATCNHWHALAGIWACQAGKHVYVEKPIAHNVWEGRKLVEAARKYDRIVQGGTNRRSSGSFRTVAKLVRDGVIGRVYWARCEFPRPRDPLGFKPAEPPPSWLDWNLWLGPAPEQAFHRNLVHYNWHWFWDFGNGEMGNNGIHIIDVCRWIMGQEVPVRGPFGGRPVRREGPGRDPQHAPVHLRVRGRVTSHLRPEKSLLGPWPRRAPARPLSRAQAAVDGRSSPGTCTAPKATST